MMNINPMGGVGAGGWNRPGPQQGPPIFPDPQQPPANHLHISWQDGRWPANFLNASNILDYFSNIYNPFYDRQSNNEQIKMQRLPPEQIVNMQGIEYTVLHALEPLFVVRKQKRHNKAQVSPVADYYIIGGTVYQAPDLCSVINSRLITAISYIRTSFEEVARFLLLAQSCSRYHPTKGYWWEFKGHTSKQIKKKEEIEVRTTAFQRTRVDALLADLTQKYPPPTTEEENHKTFTDGSSENTVNRKTETSLPTEGTIRLTRPSAAETLDFEPPTKKLKTELS